MSCTDFEVIRVIDNMLHRYISNILIYIIIIITITDVSWSYSGTNHDRRCIKKVFYSYLLESKSLTINEVSQLWSNQLPTILELNLTLKKLESEQQMIAIEINNHLQYLNFQYQRFESMKPELKRWDWYCKSGIDFGENCQISPH